MEAGTSSVCVHWLHQPLAQGWRDVRERADMQHEVVALLWVQFRLPNGCIGPHLTRCDSLLNDYMTDPLLVNIMAVYPSMANATIKTKALWGLLCLMHTPEGRLQEKMMHKLGLPWWSGG